MDTPLRASYKPEHIDYAVNELNLEGRGLNPVDPKTYSERDMNDMCFAIGGPLGENGPFDGREDSTYAMAMLFVQHRLGIVKTDKDSLELMNETLAKAKKFAHVELPGKHKGMYGMDAWTHAVENCAQICGKTIPEVLGGNLLYTYNKVDKLAEAQFEV
ncbi:hypothetical protein ACFL6C_10820 [Myxococcota bacterium]